MKRTLVALLVMAAFLASVSAPAMATVLPGKPSPSEGGTVGK